MMFGEALRELLEAVDIKQIQLAEHLGYDVSYINKWINGQKQPSVRNNRALFQNIAEFLLKSGKKVFKDNLQNQDGISYALSDDEAIQIIVEKLSSAYREPESKRGRPTPSIGNQCSFGKMSTAFTSNSQQIMRAIRAAAENGGTQTLEFISITPLDFCGHGEAKRDWMSKLELLPQQASIHVRFAADFRQKDFNQALCRDVLTFLFGLPERVRFDLFQDDRFHELRQGIYICQDAVCVHFFKNALFQNHSMITSCEPRLVSSCYSAADFLLSQSTELLHRERFSALYRQKYFRSFMLARRFSALHTVMPALCMSEVLFSSLRERYHFSDEIIDVYRFYEKTASRWSYAIFESALVRFLFDGALWMMGETVVLTEAERTEWLSDLLFQLAEKKLNINILSDMNPVLNWSDVRCSIFFNEKSLFAVRHHEADDNRQILYGDDENFIRCFRTFFQSIRDLPKQFLLTEQAVEERLKQYLQML